MTVRNEAAAARAKHLFAKSKALALAISVGLLLAPVASAQTVEAPDPAPSVFFDYDTFLSETEVGGEEEAAQMRAAVLDATAFNATLDPKTGHVAIPRAGAHLNLGEDFYFIGGGDARRLLEKWGNPPDVTTLGMIFPVGQDWMVNDYAVEISFDPSGYVSDANAESIDYDDLLAEMKRSTVYENEQRRAKKMATVDLLGWAEPPTYQADTHVMHWAKRLQFEGIDGETLNYNVRYLGRKGVLEFNYIAGVDALESIKATIPDISAMAAFDPGNTYADFDPATDEKAAYGLAGLVAGGAAVAAKKTGLLALLLVFLKKGWVLILAGGAFLFRAMRGAMGRKGDAVG